MSPPPTAEDVADAKIAVLEGKSRGAFDRAANIADTDLVPAMKSEVTPRTTPNHTGRVHHHAAVRRVGVHSPAASSAPHNDSAVRCQA